MICGKLVKSQREFSHLFVSGAGYSSVLLGQELVHFVLYDADANAFTAHAAQTGGAASCSG